MCDIIDVGSKIVGGAGVLVAALAYRRQIKIKRSEWIKSLFEKFFENPNYKEARSWLDYNELNKKLNTSDQTEKRKNEELFTDFLNFFEFIGVLYSKKELTLDEVNEIFDYYLKKIKGYTICKDWIAKYGFEKLKNLLSKI